VRRLLAALALVALVAPACCNREGDGTAPKRTELPALVLRDDTGDLLLTWLDARGNFHTAMKVADVPPEGRDAVRVVITSRDDGAATDLVYVARLSEKRPDGTYPVATMTRAEWEALAEKRRAPSVAAAPRGSGGVPRPPPVGARGGKVTVVIYGAAWCGPCHDAQEHLTRRGVPFVYKDIEADAGAAQEMARKLQRSGTRGGGIPIIDVGGHLLVGFEPGALDAAVAAASRGDPATDL
jgi:glutaredoxin